MRDWVATPGSPRVLIVDDEPAICAALLQVMRRAGFDPIVALGAPEAEALLSDSIEAMVLDLRMPHMRGDVFYYLASARFPQLRRRTLFMTGDISERAYKLILSCKCPSIRKPFELKDLIGAVEVLAPRRERARDARGQSA